MEEVTPQNETDEQANISEVNPEKKSKTSHLAPWQFKKGQSGNPLGRTKGGKSLKEYAKEYLASLTEEERLDYFEGINKLDVWKMGEGMPDTKGDLNLKGTVAVVFDPTFNKNAPPQQTETNS